MEAEVLLTADISVGLRKREDWPSEEAGFCIKSVSNCRFFVSNSWICFFSSMRETSFSFNAAITDEVVSWGP